MNIVMTQFQRFNVFVLEQRLRFHGGKYDAYLNRVHDENAVRNIAARIRIAKALLSEPEFSVTRCWGEHQQVVNRDGRI